MKNPFKKITDNSNKTKKKWALETTSSSVKSKQCESCGAPRPKNTNLTTCSYCGSRFMSIQAVISPDI